MKLTLKDKKQEAADTFSFIFNIPEGFIWKAGQFLKYKIEDPYSDERGNQRFFTIASAPFEKEVRITTRFVPEGGSSFKKYLLNMKLGEIIEAEGPFGEFVMDDPDTESVFISGGIGITPFRAILLDLDYNNQPIKVNLLYANRDENFVFKDEPEKLRANYPNLQVHYFISPQRIDEQAIREKVADLQKPGFYVSGPEPMVEAMVKMLQEMGIKDDHLKRDYFPGYNWP